MIFDDLEHNRKRKRTQVLALVDPDSKNDSKLPQIMAAAKKTVTQYSAAELGLDVADVGASGSRLKIEKLFIPETDSNVEFMGGDTPQEQAAELVRRLQADKLI